MPYLPNPFLDASMRGMRPLAIAIMAALSLGACQDYPFEFRADTRADGSGIHRLITTQKPIDIIFMLDNSQSMVDELQKIRQNLDIFINILSESESDYRIAFLAPDLECNIPGALDNCKAGGTSSSCCARSLSPCTDSDTDGDDLLDTSDCDGGRFRSHNGSTRFYKRPKESELSGWLSDIDTVIADMGCKGSGFEAGLEAVRRAVVCSLNDEEQRAAGVLCPDPAVAELNNGFIRPEADLVIIVLTDEDDCSFTDLSRYLRPPDPLSPVDQAAHLCSPQECYGYIGKDLDADLDGAIDWIDRSASPRFTCSNNRRESNPPYPDPVQSFIDDLVAVKGSARRIRVGGIVASIPDANTPLGERAASCMAVIDKVTDQCGCWSAAGGFTDIMCEVTSAYRNPLVSAVDSRVPASNRFMACGESTLSPQPGGCQAVAGGRYMQFFEKLREQGAGSAVVGSVCQLSFVQTLKDIAGAVLPSNCFILPENNYVPTDVEVRRNGFIIRNVDLDSPQDGWSLKDDRLCLEGNLVKKIGDRYEIFALAPN